MDCATVCQPCQTRAPDVKSTAAAAAALPGWPWADENMSSRAAATAVLVCILDILALPGNLHSSQPKTKNSTTFQTVNLTLPNPGVLWLPTEGCLHSRD